MAEAIWKVITKEKHIYIYISELYLVYKVSVLDEYAIINHHWSQKITQI